MSSESIQKEYPKKLQNHDALLHAVIDAAEEKDALKRIVDLCCQFWKETVVVYDASFRLLASPGDYIALTTEQKDAIAAGFFNTDNIYRLTNSGLLNVLFTQEPYSIIPFSAKIRQYSYLNQYENFVMIPIRVNGRPVGCMGMIGIRRQFTQQDAECAYKISKILSLILQKNGVQLASVINPFEGIVQDIIHGKMTNTESSKRFQALNRTLGTEHYILAIESDPLSGLSERNLHNLQNSIRQLIPFTVTTAYHDRIIVFMSLKNGLTASDVLQEQSARLSSFLKINNLKIGISACFHDISDAVCFYQQSLNALICGKRIHPGRLLYVYTDYSIADLLRICQDSMDLMRFCHPVLAQLSENDQTKDKELLRILYYYLHYSQDIRVICEKLYIQRSTLFYKINKIKQMIDEDFHNGQLQLKLLLSFEILIWLHKLDPID